MSLYCDWAVSNLRMLKAKYGFEKGQILPKKAKLIFLKKSQNKAKFIKGIRTRRCDKQFCNEARKYNCLCGILFSYQITLLTLVNIRVIYNISIFE